MKLENKVIVEMTADDFNIMSNCRMDFNNDWYEQVKDGRFDDVVGYDFRTIYWFDNRLSVIMAEAFLRSIGWEYHRAFDTYLDQDVLLTNYVVA